MNLDRLIEQIQTEVIHLSQGATAGDDVFRQQTALSLMSRVPILMSSAIYSSLIAGGIAPRGLDAMLDLGAGICGSHVQLGLAVTGALDVPCRQVQVFYVDGETIHNHTFVEIEWGQHWRMVDLTWGFIPHRGSLDSALSYEESRESNHRTGLHHSCIPWRIAVEDKYDIFGYLSEEPDAVLYDGSGEIRMSPRMDGDFATYARPHRIYEIGRLSHRVKAAERRLTLEVPDGRWSLTVSGFVTGPGTLGVGSATVDLTDGDVRLRIEASGPEWIDLTYLPAGDLGRLKIGSIEGTQSRPGSTEERSAESRIAIRLL